MRDPATGRLIPKHGLSDTFTASATPPNRSPQSILSDAGRESGEATVSQGTGGCLISAARKDHDCI
jgi:hypothetical protein